MEEKKVLLSVQDLVVKVKVRGRSLTAIRKRVQNLRYILCHGGHLAVQHKRRFELDAVLNDGIHQRQRNIVLAFAEHKLHGEGQSKAAVQSRLRHLR